MHAHQLWDLDPLSGAPVENELALLQATLIHAHVRELTKASLLELECESNQGRRCRWNKLHLWRARVLRRIVRKDLTLRRTREVRTNTVEEWLHRSVLDSRAEEYGRELKRDGRTPDRRCELYVGRQRIVKEKIRDFVVDFCKLFDQLCAFLSG